MEKLFNIKLSKIYPLLVAKAQKKNRSEEEVIKAVRGVTLDEIRQTAKEIFDFSKLSLVLFGLLDMMKRK